MFVVLCRTPCRCSCSSPSYCVMCGELLRRPLRPREGGVTFADGLSLLRVMYFFLYVSVFSHRGRNHLSANPSTTKISFFFSPMRIIKPQAAMRTQNDGYTASYPKLTFFFSFSFSLLLTFVGNSPLLHPIYKARGKQCGGCSSASLRFRWVTLLSHCQKRIPHMSS